jgi:hypothetical protein
MVYHERGLAHFSLNLSQGGAAHLIEGASGNFSGRLSLYHWGPVDLLEWRPLSMQ